MACMAAAGRYSYSKQKRKLLYFLGHIEVRIDISQIYISDNSDIVLSRDAQLFIGNNLLLAKPNK